ncbi:MAG: tyrosine-type recombinase/integrase, partial [Verrucomicrobiota bacterium]
VGVESIKVKSGDVELFTPDEISRLLAAAPIDFRPCLTIGAFAGLGSTEIERLEWSDIDFAGRRIVVGASRAKTATRRVVPLDENVAQWLAPYGTLYANIGGPQPFPRLAIGNTLGVADSFNVCSKEVPRPE